VCHIRTVGAPTCDVSLPVAWACAPPPPGACAHSVAVCQQMGEVLRDEWAGEAYSMVKAARNSAVRLVRLITNNLPGPLLRLGCDISHRGSRLCVTCSSLCPPPQPGFRDHAVYKGRQVFFYKRAQILVADLWGAYVKCGVLLVQHCMVWVVFSLCVSQLRKAHVW